MPPRVRLNVTASSGETSTTVTRINPNGSVVPVRTTDGNPLLLSSGSGLLYDYEAPIGSGVTFSSLESPATISAQVAVNVPDVWLIHPGVPSLSVIIAAAGITGRTRRVTRGVFYPLGGGYPVTRTDGARKSPEYTLTIQTTTDSDRAAIDALLDDASVLLLNVPAGKGWGITAEYVSAGDSLEDRLYQYGAERRRTWQLPLLVTDRPVGGSQAQRTLADLTVFSTLAGFRGAYSSLAALNAGP